jgi:hypothetical protein
MCLTETVVADVEEEVGVDGGGMMTTTSRWWTSGGGHLGLPELSATEYFGLNKQKKIEEKNWVFQCSTNRMDAKT